MSWASVKVHGIVLSIHKFREADRRYRALTPQGKIEFVGRGAQKKLAKLASHLEPFAIVDLEIIRGKKSVTVISVERIEWFKHISTSFEARLLATSSLHLLDKYTYEGEEDVALYEELVVWLNFLNQDQYVFLPGRSTFLLGGFLLRCLTHLGYSIELTTCMNCKSDIHERAFKWHAGKGGLVCTNCIQAQPQDWFSARDLHESIIKLLRFARSEPYAELMKLHLKGGQIEAYARVVQDLLYFHLPHRNTTPYWQGVMVDYGLDLPQKQV